MEIKISKNADCVTLTPVGNIDYVSSPELDATVTEQAATAEAMVIDLSETNYISSAGLRVLLNADELMDGKGGLKVINASPSVMEVLVMTGFSEALNIE